MKVKHSTAAGEPAAEQEPDLVLPVLQDLLICLQILLNSLLELDTVDLDPEKGRCKVGIEREGVVVIHFPSLHHRRQVKVSPAEANCMFKCQTGCKDLLSTILWPRMPGSWFAAA